MADKSEYLFRWFITFALLGVPAAVANTNECSDGTYKHEGRDCCLCASGTSLVTHCSEKPSDGKCEICGPDKYIDYPNNRPTCEDCTSCSHQNENLEYAEECTRARNAKCRCKKDHFCVSPPSVSCRLCHPCKKCGAEGIKAACAGYNDTVCNDITEGNNAGTIAAVIVPILAVAVAVGVFLFRRKKKLGKRNQETSNNLANGNATDVEMQQLRDIDLQPLLPAIAEAVGWKAMRDVAGHTKVPDTVIESCQLDHPSNSQEQTFQLLKIWVERQGEEAHSTLIQTLVETNYKNKANKVRAILTGEGK